MSINSLDLCCNFVNKSPILTLVILRVFHQAVKIPTVSIYPESRFPEYLMIEDRYHRSRRRSKVQKVVCRKQSSDFLTELYRKRAKAVRNKLQIASITRGFLVSFRKSIFRASKTENNRPLQRFKTKFPYAKFTSICMIWCLLLIIFKPIGNVFISKNEGLTSVGIIGPSER